MLESSVQGRGRNAEEQKHVQKSVAIVQLHVSGGAAACAVAVTCSASDAQFSLSRLPKLAKPASRLASLAAARELLMLSLLLIVGTGSFK